MPLILVGTSQCNEQMWQSLKTHIMRDRQRKKQADKEEERLRKEREHQQKQDVMTFGETQEQITNLQNEILELETEKHDLFTELKRILYEEGTRKQFAKENNICSEVLTVEGYSIVHTKIIHPQLLPTTQNSSLYESNVEPQVLTTGFSKKIFSPPPIPSTSYQISCHKPLPYILNYNPPSSSTEDSIDLSKKNGYSSIMSQLSREILEQSKPTYPIGGRTGGNFQRLSTIYQSVYAANIHSIERCNSAYNEEKHYLRPNQSTIHSIPIQQSSQGTKADGIATVQAPAVIPYQPLLQPPPLPHRPITQDDVSHITLNKILYSTPFKVPISYNKTGLLHKSGSL